MTDQTFIAGKPVAAKPAVVTRPRRDVFSKHRMSFVTWLYLYASLFIVAAILWFESSLAALRRENFELQKKTESLQAQVDILGRGRR